MEKSLNKKITETILKHIPRHIKPVPYLMSFLDLGRLSTYRRLKGEIPFTVDEILKLSKEFGFSIDKIISENDNRYLSGHFIADETNRERKGVSRYLNIIRGS